LVRLTPSGATHVLARGVLSCDITATGETYYSGGNAVYQLDPDSARPRRLLVSSLIEQVCGLC
jgi:hypothetical protein